MSTETKAPDQEAHQRIYEIPLEKIQVDPTQPRKYFNEQSLRELAESIERHGLLLPILVRPTGDGLYRIVHGERRFKAHQLLKLPTIDCFIRTMSDSQANDVQLNENLERDSLSDIELAYEFQRRTDQGQTHQQIATAIGKTRSYVTQRLALLRLSKRLQDLVMTGDLSFSKARELLFVKDVALREQVADQILGSTVMETVAMIKQHQGAAAVTRVTTLPFPDCRCLACDAYHDCYS